MAKEGRPLKVFLSHAHSDRDAVQALYQRLTRDGVDAWLDKEKLIAGQDWQFEIRNAVRDADVVVVCLSRNFNQSGFRQKEVRIALDTAMELPEGEIFIIPARLEECDTLESLRKWHWVDLFDADGYEMLLRALQARSNKIGATVNVRKTGWLDTLLKPFIKPITITSSATPLDPIIQDIRNANTTPKIGNVFKSISEVSLLDSDPDARRFWVAISKVSQHINAAISSETAYNRRGQLEEALKATKQILNTIEDYPDYHIARQTEASLKSWEKIIYNELQLVSKKEQIPNVYIAGTPLAESSKVFKGRKDLFRLLERELATEAEQRPAILLFGARRTGKTSVLRQLPNALGPQVIPAMVDLQGIALANDANGVFLGMAEEIRRSALLTRNIDLPDIERNLLKYDPYKYFSEWFKRIDGVIGNRWMLLCLDEYEYFEKMLNDGRVDIRAFQLLRNLIQNFPKLTILFSGAHTFEELKSEWSNYLINVRTLRISSLDEIDAYELVAHPIEQFPLKYTKGAIERIFSTTSGQPYLIQATCRDLVNILNDEDRKNAEEKDVDRALNSVLTSGSSYFYDLWRGETNASQQKIMAYLAKRKDQFIDEFTLLEFGTPSDLHRLMNHDVIMKNEKGYCFKVELVRQWVESQT